MFGALLVEHHFLPCFPSARNNKPKAPRSSEGPGGAPQAAFRPRRPAAPKAPSRGFVGWTRPLAYPCVHMEPSRGSLLKETRLGMLGSRLVEGKVSWEK